MNAPATIKTIDRLLAPGQLPDGAALSGVARHVCVDGCQFVLSGHVPAVGDRLWFALASGEVITGWVSWILGERIGFAFSEQIGPATMSALSSHPIAFTGFDLRPC